MRTFFIQFLTFTGIGAVGTAAHFSVLIFLVELCGLPVLAGTTVGFILGAGINYLLNYRFTFKSRLSHSVTFAKFFIITGLGVCLNGLIVYSLEMWLHYLICQVIATGVVLLWNFFCNLIWTFKEVKYAQK